MKIGILSLYPGVWLVRNAGFHGFHELFNNPLELKRRRSRSPLPQLVIFFRHFPAIYELEKKAKVLRFHLEVLNPVVAGVLVLVFPHDS